MAKVRSAALFYNKKRCARLMNVTYDIETNDGQEMTDAGTEFTDGIATAKVTADQLIPIAGIGLSMIKDALAHKDVTLSLGLIDGAIHELDARFKTISITSETATGKLTGKFELMCKTPRITS